jgi:nucleoside-diphosphate-sugar epimerase
MKYFVTGATGFLGGHLARILREQGHDVIALVRTPSKAATLKELGVQLAEGDITDKASLRDPMQGVDGVYHVAAWYKVGQRDSSMAYDINVNGTRNVLEVMRDLSIPKAVYTSSLVVFGDTQGQKRDENYRYDGKHLSVYDQTKWQAHHKVALPMIKEGLPLVIVQAGTIYGIGDTSDIHDFVLQYLQRKAPMLPKGFTACWAHVEDIVQGHLAAMEKGKVGETYNICGDCHSIIEFFQTAEKITGVPAPRIHVPPVVFKTMTPLMSLIEKVIPLPPAYTSEGMRVVAGVTYLGDNSKARRELGFNPRPLEEGLREVLAHEMKLLGIPMPTA